MSEAYRQAVDYLAGLEAARGWDLGLARVERALALCGHPERRLRVLHVAGTNGKGTTAAVLESVLRAAGVRTGLYTSPHLVDFAERIRAGGRTIPEDAVVARVEALRASLARHDLALTHFEFVTVLGLEWFASVGVEVAVVEVGLGGRLDATNVVTPIGAAVTTIAHDHEAFLGWELRAIAREKAGIVKAGVPVTIGPLPPEAVEVVCEVAAGCGAPVHRLGVDGQLEGPSEAAVFEGLGVRWDGLRIPWTAAWQRANAGVALLALAAARHELPLTPDAVRRGLAATEWPGRLVSLPGRPDVVVDGAHNPAGARALAEELPRVLRGRRARVVFACGRDRPWDAMVATIAPWAAEALVTEVGRRPAPAAAVALSFQRRGVPTRIDTDAPAALAAALGARTDAPTLITGSLFLVGEAYALVTPRLWSPWQGWEVDATEPPR